MEKKYQNSQDFILREMADECVLVPLNDACIVSNGIVYLNDTSAFLWKCFEEPRTISEVIALARKEYDDPNNELEMHIRGYVKQYLELKIMAEV